MVDTDVGGRDVFVVVVPDGDGCGGDTADKPLRPDVMLSIILLFSF